jgi:hypothetical protein
MSHDVAALDTAARVFHHALIDGRRLADDPDGLDAL